MKAENKITDVVASESISTLYRRGESTDKITTDIRLVKDLNLPVKRGEKVGELIVKNGEYNFVKKCSNRRRTYSASILFNTMETHMANIGEK